MRRQLLRDLSAALMLGLLLAPWPPSPAAAQDGSRVEQELQRTDEGLENAARIVHESQSRLAVELLQHARNVQHGAWARFRDGRPAVALRMTQEARKLGARAVAVAREHRGLRGRAERELEKAARALSRARDELGDVPDDRAFRLLEEAQVQIQRGRHQLDQQHFEVTVRLAISAQRLIHQAVGSAPGHAGDRRIRRELERTDSLFERAGSIVRDAGVPEATRALQRGAELQQDAWQAYRTGQLRRALATTREARNLVNRALYLVRGPVDSDQVEAALAETDRLLERASELVREAGDEQAARLLEKAIEHQVRARRLLGEREVRTALAETRVARRLAMRALQMVQGRGGI